MKHVFLSCALISAITMSAGPVLAADQDQDRIQDQDMERTRDRLQEQDHVYGSQLMTQEERNQYRARMQAAKTEKEREQIRNEHHERMKIRAKERGVSIPDDPPAKGGNMMGPGEGSGSGGGRR